MSVNGKKETKERILYAAKKEFAEHGYDGARMGAIAKRANVNQALLHYYFKTKDKLYGEVLQHYLLLDDEKLIRDRVADWDWDLSREEELYMGIYILVNFPLGALDPEFSRIMSREAAGGRDHLENITQDYVLPKMKSFQEVIQRGIDEGIFETSNPYLVVMQLIIFVIYYENSKLTASDNKDQFSWRNVFPSENDKDEIFRFLLEDTVKGLTPVGKVVTIPEFPRERLEVIDRLIAEIGKMRIAGSEVAD